MDNALKGIILAVGVVITCVVIGIAFYYSRESKNLSSKASGDLNDLTSEFDDPQKLTFDGMTVTGREVINQIEKYATDPTTVIRVIHKDHAVDMYNSADAVAYCKDKDAEVKGTETEITKYTAVTYDRTQDANADTFINEGGKFVGSVQKNADGVITMITFAQEGTDKSLSSAAHSTPLTSAGTETGSVEVK